KPERHLPPRLNLLLKKEGFIHPGEDRIASTDHLAYVQDLLHGGRLRETGDVVNSHLARFHHMYNPFRRVAHVDQLYRARPATKGQDFAPSCDTAGPVGETVAVVMGTNEQAKANT